MRPLPLSCVLAFAACAAPLDDARDALDAGDAGDVDAGHAGDVDAGALEGPDAGALEEPDAGALEGPDDDGDGLDDAHELALATAYLPFLSNHPDDDCPRSGIVFRARPHPDDASFVHVVYSRLYERDCGITSHPGDNEAFAVTLDPTRPAPDGIVAVRAISHQDTLCERDTLCGACADLDACDVAGDGRPVVYASRDKHASTVHLARGCSLLGSCLDRCALAAVSDAPPLVNAGEPEAPLIDDLSDPTQGGFITPANGWSEPSMMHYDPWGGLEFGEAGVVADDLVDPAFTTPACR